MHVARLSIHDYFAEKIYEEASTAYDGLLPGLFRPRPGISKRDEYHQRRRRPGQFDPQLFSRLPNPGPEPSIRTGCMPGVNSLGGYVGYKGYSYSATDYSEKWHYTVLGVRSAYHYNGLNVEKLDLYGGVMLSYNILSYSYSDIGGYNFSGSGSYGSTVGFSLYVGARVFFTDNLAVLAELGYGVAYLNVGIAAKF
jgi:hypothetical protein